MKDSKKFIPLVLALALTFSSCNMDFVGNIKDFFGNSSTQEPQEITVDLVLEQLTTQKIKALAVNGAVDVSQTMDDMKYTGVAKMDAGLNVDDGDLDFVGYVNAKKNGQLQNAVATMAFMDDWQVFIKAINNAPSAEFSYYRNPENVEYLELSENFKEIMEKESVIPEEYEAYDKEILEILGYEEGKTVKDTLVSAVNGVNALIIELADAAGAITLSEKEMMVNIPQFVANVQADAVDFIEDFTIKTTLKELLLQEQLKKYMNSLTRDIDAKELQDGMKKLYEAVKEDFSDETSLTIEDWANIFKIICINPNDHATAYEYLVELICSEEFYELTDGQMIDCNTSIFEQTTGMYLEDGYHEYKDLNEEQKQECITHFEDEIKEIADVIKEIVLVEDGKITFGSDENTAIIEGCEFVYGLHEDNTISDLSVKGSLKMGNIEGSLEGKISFMKEATTVTDISNFKVFAETTGEYLNGVSENYIYDSNQSMYIYPEIQNGKLVGFVTKQEEYVGEWIYVTYDNTYNAETGTLVVNGEYTYQIETEMNPTDYAPLYINISNKDAYWSNSNYYPIYQEETIQPVYKTVKEYMQTLAK